MLRFEKAVLVIAVMSCAAGALASDGVLEINQACAQSAGGCFPGDAGGFPVTIGQSGSYRLTSNLEITDQTADVVEISATDVAIDLNRFTISGACAAPCQGTGVSGGPARSSLSNGTVRQLATGVLLGSDARVDDVETSENQIGLKLGSNASVIRTRALRNNLGMELMTGSLVSDCLVNDNTGYGLLGGSRTVVVDSVASGNGASGVYFADGTVSRVTANSNGNGGIFLVTGTVSDVVAAGNAFDGIYVGTGTVSDSTAQGNNRCGIFLGAGGFGGNTVLGNNPSGSQCGNLPHSHQVNGTSPYPTSCNVVQCPSGGHTVWCPQFVGFSCP